MVSIQNAGTHEHQLHKSQKRLLAFESPLIARRQCSLQSNKTIVPESSIPLCTVWVGSSVSVFLARPLAIRLQYEALLVSLNLRR
jgi:hypothetical protein